MIKKYGLYMLLGIVLVAVVGYAWDANETNSETTELTTPFNALKSLNIPDEFNLTSIDLLDITPTYAQAISCSVTNSVHLIATDGSDYPLESKTPKFSPSYSVIIPYNQKSLSQTKVIVYLSCDPSTLQKYGYLPYLTGGTINVSLQIRDSSGTLSSAIGSAPINVQPSVVNGITVPIATAVFPAPQLQQSGSYYSQQVITTSGKLTFKQSLTNTITATHVINPISTSYSLLVNNPTTQVINYPTSSGAFNYVHPTEPCVDANGNPTRCYSDGTANPWQCSAALVAAGYRTGTEGGCYPPPTAQVCLYGKSNSGLCNPKPNCTLPQVPSGNGGCVLPPTYTQSNAPTQCYSSTGNGQCSVVNVSQQIYTTKLVFDKHNSDQISYTVRMVGWDQSHPLFIQIANADTNRVVNSFTTWVTPNNNDGKTSIWNLNLSITQNLGGKNGRYSIELMPYTTKTGIVIPASTVYFMVIDSSAQNIVSCPSGSVPTVAGSVTTCGAIPACPQGSTLVRDQSGQQYCQTSQSATAITFNPHNDASQCQSGSILIPDANGGKCMSSQALYNQGIQNILGASGQQNLFNQIFGSFGNYLSGLVGAH